MNSFGGKGSRNYVFAMKMFGGKDSNFAPRFHNSGFTFVEMLISFSLFLLLTSFFSMGLQMLLKEGLMQGDVQKLEWEVFVSQVQKEFRMSDGDFTLGEQLSFTVNGRKVTYDMWGTNLRRQVDGQGHELILQRVNAVTFEPVLQGVKIMATDRFQHTYSAVIRTPLRGDRDDS